jgi:hypothetical protein
MTDCISPDDFYELEGTPFIKNPLNFFSSTKTNRYLLVISDDPNSWKKDMVLAEKMFGHLLISNSSSEFSTEFPVHQEVLRHRLKVPGIQNNPELMKTAKIWILPNKLIKAPPPDILQNSFDSSIQPLLNSPQGSLSYVKIDLTDGKERMMVYRILDDGYRPGLICVKWSNDLDEHYATAYCAGHLMNAGYVHVMSIHGYSLYYYGGLSLYDSCSMKEISWGNPIAQSFLATSKAKSEEDKKGDDTC